MRDEMEQIVSAAEANNQSIKTKDFIDRAHELKQQLDLGLERVDDINDVPDRELSRVLRLAVRRTSDVPALLGLNTR